MPSTFACPHCHTPIDLAAMQDHLLAASRESLERELEKSYQERLRSLEISNKEAQEKKDLELKKEYWAKAQSAAAEKNARELMELEELKKQDEISRKANLDLMRERAELLSKQKNMELEFEARAVEARAKLEIDLAAEAQKRASLDTDKMRLEFERRASEMQKQMEQMQRSVEDAHRKANQGSMQIQGDSQENLLKSDLASAFPTDRIDDVPTGVKGADIIHGVRNRSLQEIGIIAWEAKMTKAWEDKWIAKLKEDRLRVGADVSVIVTAVLPKWIEHFGLYQGIWVTAWPYAGALAQILRDELIQLHAVKGSLVAKDEKMEVLYSYLTSPEFRDKIQNIVEAFQSLQDELQKEKRAMESIWARREKQLGRIISNTGKLYGDMQGLLGKSAGTIPALELESPETEEHTE